ncbi:MAG: 1-acyl-sn-glycerol-3-phosphate acyltransferase [Burkholderiaceae bacterium]|nr:1-acyl-sn-glycerol-3-phosphate acyltransferase [Burkholderiaceae bacterium]
MTSTFDPHQTPQSSRSPQSARSDQSGASPRAPVSNTGGGTKPPSQRPGSRLARWVLQLAGWKLLEADLPGARGIVVVYPHTSNWDFIVGICYKWAVGWQVRFWAKSTLVEAPVIGAWMRWLGAVAVHRNNATGMVGSTAADMLASDEFWLVLAPEGTRSYVNGWRMGFYHLWQATQVPLVVAVIDYANKEVGYKGCLSQPSSTDADLEFARIAAIVDGAQGHRPALQSPIKPYVRPAVSNDAANAPNAPH